MILKMRLRNRCQPTEDMKRGTELDKAEVVRTASRGQMGPSLGYENGTTCEILERGIDLVLWAYEGASGLSRSVALYIPEIYCGVDHVPYRKHGESLSS